MHLDEHETPPWYRGITRYQWLVLLIASLGWIFDVFEGQIFVASMREAMPSLTAADAPQGSVDFYNNVALGAFLLGGALGGIVFGMLSDRIGRKRTLSWTIIFYSLFTFASAFSREWWHLAAFRFLVAMGVGGEWAVASALVAEVFPRRARAHVASLFHASSVLGVYLAVAVGTFVIGNPYFANLAEQSGHPSLPWRIAFAIGALPAVLIVWVRRRLKETEGWSRIRARASEGAGRTGSLGSVPDLFRRKLARKTLVGVALASVGMATFWGVHIYGKDALRGAVERETIAGARLVADELTADAREAVLEPHSSTLKRWEMGGMFLVTTGAGIGLACFGSIAQRVGRRRAFLIFHLGGLTSALIVFQLLESVSEVLIALPIFGFLTSGMHAGYAVYFPELFPTRLRGTGTGFCFNMGRMVAAPILVLTGWMQRDWGLSVESTASLLSVLFILGIVLLPFAPETRGQELPD